MKIKLVVGCLCAVGLTWTVTPPAWAQAGPDAEESVADRPAAGEKPNVDYDSEPPYTAYERYWNRRFPAPYRKQFRREYYPFGRPYYPRRYYDRYPRGRSHWGPDPYATPGWGTPAFDDGYTGGFQDGRRFQKWQQQAEKGVGSYLKAMERGGVAFRNGDYGGAARQFILAAKLNQGDPASRLHAVHALTALGHYADAVPALRRALQLQPRLLYLPLDIRSEYGRPGDFATHLAALSAAAKAEPGDADVWLLLGYYQFFSGSGPEAVRSLRRAAQLSPDDKAVNELYQAARLSTPVERAAPPAASGDV